MGLLAPSLHSAYSTVTIYLYDITRRKYSNYTHSLLCINLLLYTPIITSNLWGTLNSNSWPWWFSRLVVLTSVIESDRPRQQRTLHLEIGKNSLSLMQRMQQALKVTVKKPMPTTINSASLVIIVKHFLHSVHLFDVIFALHSCDKTVFFRAWIYWIITKNIDFLVWFTIQFKKLISINLKLTNKYSCMDKRSIVLL